MTISQTVAADVAALLRARNPLLWIVTREEARVESWLLEAGGAASYITRTWDVADGIREGNGKLPDRRLGTNMNDKLDPEACMEVIRLRAEQTYGTPERGLWIMRDLPAWLTGPGGAKTLRCLRNLARLLPTAEQDKAQAVIVLTTNAEVPPELSGHATVIEWPLPDREEIGEMLDAAIPENLEGALVSPEHRAAAIDAAVGLTGEEAQACFAKSLVQLRRIDPSAIASEKKRIIARERVLEWYDPIPGGLTAVGGLDNLKAWLLQRSAAYSPAARAYGLPAPKGVFLAGIQGCGKSLTAKAVSTAWGVPLLKLDLGALKSKFVGESEANIRKAFKVIEAIGRCVVWVDEIEKALAGATQGGADGGVSADALGVFLTWMQERKTEAFVLATANKVEGLPPELLRKGRFDEIFFVDLPDEAERCGVLTAALVAHGRKDFGGINIPSVAAATDKFTGSEIAELVPTAMFAAFADGAREITTEDLLTAAKEVVPLSKTMGEELERLQKWGRERAKSASKTEAQIIEGLTTRRVARRKLDV